MRRASSFVSTNSVPSPREKPLVECRVDLEFVDGRYDGLQCQYQGNRQLPDLYGTYCHGRCSLYGRQLEHPGHYLDHVV